MKELELSLLFQYIILLILFFWELGVLKFKILKGITKFLFALNCILTFYSIFIIVLIRFFFRNKKKLEGEKNSLAEKLIISIFVVDLLSFFLNIGIMVRMMVDINTNQIDELVNENVTAYSIKDIMTFDDQLSVYVISVLSCIILLINFFFWITELILIHEKKEISIREIAHGINNNIQKRLGNYDSIIESGQEVEIKIGNGKSLCINKNEIYFADAPKKEIPWIGVDANGNKIKGEPEISYIVGIYKKMCL